MVFALVVSGAPGATLLGGPLLVPGRSVGDRAGEEGDQDSVLQDIVCIGDTSTVGVITFREDLGHNEMAGSSENMTSYSIEEYFITKAMFSSVTSLRR